MEGVMNLEFRLWHKQEQRYGSRLDLDEHRIDYDFNGGIVNLEFAIKHPEYFLVEQWTGEVDSNGNKIFDGDIIKRVTSQGPDSTDKLRTEYFSGNEATYAVSWSNYSDGEYVDEVKCWMLGEYNSLSELMYEQTFKFKKWIHTYQIIGNINENPDLLNDRK